MTHAIICAAHAVYLAGDVYLDSSWVLQPFQQGEPPDYIRHIERAVQLAASDPAAILVLSGGQTRAEAGPRSEAQGYFDVACRLDWFRHPEVRSRTLLEEFARDSFENLLFGICRFKQARGVYPDRVTIVTWAFKRERFEFHRATLRLAPETFSFEGVNNPAGLSVAMEGEQHALAEFRRDPLGQGHHLAAKRARRNPFQRQHPFHLVCPEFTPFLGTIGLQPSTSADASPGGRKNV